MHAFSRVKSLRWTTKFDSSGQDLTGVSENRDSQICELTSKKRD
jgi:hypothetical protein